MAKNTKLTNEEIDRRLIGKNIKRRGEYVNSYTLMRCICLIPSCTYEWSLLPNDLRKSGCPKCARRAKLTNEEVDRRLGGRPIQRVGDYIDISTPIQFHCTTESCQYDWNGRPNGILNKGQGCPKCAGHIPLTNEIIDRRLIGRNIQRIDNCIDAKTPILFKCLATGCGDEWKASPTTIGQNHGCPACGKSKPLSNEEIDRRLIGRNIKRLSDYINNRTPMRLICLNDGWEWNATANNIFHPTWETGCPECALGKNEKLVGQTLRDHQIKFEAQKSIKLIIASERSGIRVDFYIPKIDIIVEYNGTQHYEPAPFAGMTKEQAEVNFVKQQARDLYLTQFCSQNNIILIWIDGRKYKGTKLKDYMVDTIIPQLLKVSAA